MTLITMQTKACTINLHNFVQGIMSCCENMDGKNKIAFRKYVSFYMLNKVVSFQKMVQQL